MLMVPVERLARMTRTADAGGGDVEEAGGCPAG